MQEITVVLSLVIAVAGLGLTGLVVLILRNRSLTNSIDFCLSEISFLELQIEELALSLGDVDKRVGSLQYRRPQQTAKPREKAETATEYVETTPKRSRLTDQRSRVLALASKGQDPSTIAATLGMMPGEVELILNLNSHYVAA